MRRLSLSGSDDYASDTLLRLSSNSPGGLLFPKLESLSWYIHTAPSALPFFHLFLSPHLQRVDIHGYLPDILERVLTPLTQMISLLPTSLQYLSIMCGQLEDEPFRDAISSLVCRCGPLLRSLETSVSLSEAAINHIMHLPNISHWTLAKEPPRVVPTPVLPSLESIRLYEPEALPWLHLLAWHERDLLRNDSTLPTPYTSIRERLKCLECLGTIVNTTFVSSVVRFPNLVILNVYTECYGAGGCIFRLTDDDMEDLAASVPHLKTLQLGLPCWLNSCNTTVASLMSISVHCLDLTVLQTHFNTRTIVSDMQRLVSGGIGRDKVKCKLQRMMVRCLPLEVAGEDIETVAMGFKVIFPCLTGLWSQGSDWERLRSKIAGLRR